MKGLLKMMIENMRCEASPKIAVKDFIRNCTSLGARTSILGSVQGISDKFCNLGGYPINLQRKIIGHVQQDKRVFLFELIITNQPDSRSIFLQTQLLESDIGPDNILTIRKVLSNFDESLSVKEKIHDSLLYGHDAEDTLKTLSARSEGLLAIVTQFNLLSTISDKVH